ncbi:MAG: condensation domain-containing protein, partial [Psychrosphaera sp.]|nr:condensation domain-containing protein [Psychrosphaera sp.]
MPSEDLNNVIEHHQVNALWLTAGLFSEWSYSVPANSSLQYLLAGGDVLDPDAIKRVQQVLPTLTLINGYGPTENTTFSTTYTFEQPHTLDIVPIGKKLATDEAYILNSVAQLVPLGTVGELHVGGDGLARGYLNRPQLTAECFIDNPFYDAGKPNSSKRLYKTGDLVRLLPDDETLTQGNLAFVGRLDDQVKIRGFRIELGEVEAQLVQLDVVDSALVMVNSQLLVGYIKPVSGQDNDMLVKRVIDALGVLLPAYMVPSFIIPVDQWPLTANGKVDRKALPQPDGSALQGEYVAPHTETEQALVEIWAELLGIDAKTISATANFFELGGHSLLSMRLVAQIRSRCKVEVSVARLFDNSTLQALAVVIEQSSQAAKRPRLTAFKRDSDKLAVSFSQQRLWFIDSLQGGTPEYNMPMVFEVTGKLDITLLTAVFNTIIERHEVLRTVYVDEQGETLQHIRRMSDVDFAIKIQDLSHLSDDIVETQIKALVGADIATPFNLSSDLMLRVSLVKKKADSGVLIFNMHHISSDGWSMDVLIREFFVLYGAYSQNQLSPLKPLAIQYADYAHWQREYLQGEVLETQLDYWDKQLDDLPIVHSLALDYARPAIKQHVGAVESRKLPANIAKGLLLVAKQHQLTPFMLLHGALSLLLSRHSNSEDIVVGTPIANRLEVALEPLIGFFVNTLVLRVDTHWEHLSDYFAHVRQVHLDAQSHQDVPFERLVERLNAPRSKAHGPLFQIMMTTNTDYGLNDDTDATSFTLPGVDIQGYQSGQFQEKFDMTIELSISEQGMGLNWKYDVSLFTAKHIAQMNDHLCRLLQWISDSENQTQPLKTLSLLNPKEVQHLLFELNDSKMDYPKDQCLHQLFEQQAVENPDKVALVLKDKQLTYRQLNEKANRLAHYLQQNHPITPDTLVPMHLKWQCLPEGCLIFSLICEIKFESRTWQQDIC